MKVRLDTFLVERDLAADIDEARAFIMSGIVRSGDCMLDKPGMMVERDIILTIKSRKGHQWASRGGLKLDHALKYFSINPKDKIAIDIGASTGGFTDVLLHHGAKKVYAVDVGYGQLDWRLQQNSRVVVLDRTNARMLTRQQIQEPIDMIVCDASFISLRVILPAAMAMASERAILIALIKPQFELPKEDIGEGGIVTDPGLHRKACFLVEEWLKNEIKWHVLGITESPITGQKGNKEFLIAANGSH